ncbi:hypothetical protein EDB84DRAFT_633166 [Lactarius hengduanensis]|nr:hypothetical protein EDB84DRAFT_633166 [Lactarius hengduanensis]
MQISSRVVILYTASLLLSCSHPTPTSLPPLQSPSHLTSPVHPSVIVSIIIYPYRHLAAWADLLVFLTCCECCSCYVHKSARYMVPCRHDHIEMGPLDAGSTRSPIRNADFSASA